MDGGGDGKEAETKSWGGVQSASGTGGDTGRQDALRCILTPGKSPAEARRADGPFITPRVSVPVQ